MNRAIATRSGEVVDPWVDVLSVRPLQLPCTRCGRTLSAHVGDTPDCDGFLRPVLPPAYAYIDELGGGDRFRFLTRNRQASPRVAARAPFDLDPATGLLQLESHAPDSEDVIHLVERNTIVHRVQGRD